MIKVRDLMILNEAALLVRRLNLDNYYTRTFDFPRKAGQVDLFK